VSNSRWEARKQRAPSTPELDVCKPNSLLESVALRQRHVLGTPGQDLPHVQFIASPKE
jgi:hypothetical protein